MAAMRWRDGGDATAATIVRWRGGAAEVCACRPVCDGACRLRRAKGKNVFTQVRSCVVKGGT
eukprot:2246502-Prymnesium_polylepis.1